MTDKQTESGTQAQQPQRGNGSELSGLVMYRHGMDGCSDGGCIFQDNSNGMHTNGGCQCEKELRRHPQGLKAIQTIHFLRSPRSATQAEGTD